LLLVLVKLLKTPNHLQEVIDKKAKKINGYKKMQKKFDF